METSPGKHITRSDQVNGRSFTVDLIEWKDGVTIEAINVDGEDTAYLPNTLFVSADAALAAGRNVASNITGGEPIVTVDGIKAKI